MGRVLRSCRFHLTVERTDEHLVARRRAPRPADLPANSLAATVDQLPLPQRMLPCGQDSGHTEHESVGEPRAEQIRCHLETKFVETLEVHTNMVTITKTSHTWAR